jgi:ketosteroid isomerase-like protein
MSQENVQIVRESVDAWNRKDLEGLLEYLSPEWEWHPARLYPGTDAVYRGKEGFTRFWKSFREAWVSIRVAQEPSRFSNGRGGFRTCDLSRVKRALSH